MGANRGGSSAFEHVPTRTSPIAPAGPGATAPDMRRGMQPHPTATQIDRNIPHPSTPSADDERMPSQLNLQLQLQHLRLPSSSRSARADASSRRSRPDNLLLDPARMPARSERSQLFEAAPAHARERVEPAPLARPVGEPALRKSEDGLLNVRPAAAVAHSRAQMPTAAAPRHARDVVAGGQR